MTHIFSQQRGFVFVHNPKAGGTTIRAQLFKHDETGGLFKPNMRVFPCDGRIDMGHMTLPVMARHFPDHFAQVRDLSSFGFIRETVERFGSALAEHVRRFRGRTLNSYSDTERQELIDDVRRAIEPSTDCAPAEYCHFSRQKNFFYLEGEKVVRNVYRLEDLDSAVTELNRITGRKLATEARNKTILGDSGAGASERRGLRKLLNFVSTEKAVKSWNILPELAEGPVRVFIDDYYAEDRDLHHALASSSADTSTILTEN